jgi:CHASE2 domain-containing sensor protein
MSDKSRATARWRQIAAAWLHRLRVALLIRTDPRSKTIRARTLTALIAVLFAVIGVMRELELVGFVFNQPFDLDWALRTVSLGWYEPDAALPVTVVDIDEATYQDWKSPALTRRDKLAVLIEVVTRAEPSAVVVDIDLSGRVGDADPKDEQRLMDLLAKYRGDALLIFPKRMAPGDDGIRHAAASAYDLLFEGNKEKLRWAHATFVTDGDGAVRHWEEWQAVCSNRDEFWMPAVSIEVVNALAETGQRIDPVPKPRAAARCRVTDPAFERRLLVGPRITGPSARPFARDARAVSALVLLDPAIDRDDQGLFKDRVVLIGATHSASGDFWMTPGGVVPGVELLANTIHYALIDSGDGPVSEIAYRGLAILLFLIFVGSTWWLRGIVAFFAGLIAALVVVAIVIGGWNYFRVFESLESAIWLTVLYYFLQATLDLAEDLKWRWKSFPPGKDRFLRTLRAAFLVDEE